MTAPLKDLTIALSLTSGDGKLAVTNHGIGIENDFMPRILLNCENAGIGNGHLLRGLTMIQRIEQQHNQQVPTSLEHMLAQAFALGVAFQQHKDAEEM